MIISSELTGKTYDNVDACLADEAEFKRAKAEEEEKAKLQALAEAKAEKAVIDAFHNYCKVVGVTQQDVTEVGFDIILKLMFGDDDWSDEDE